MLAVLAEHVVTIGELVEDLIADEEEIVAEAFACDPGADFGEDRLDLGEGGQQTAFGGGACLEAGGKFVEGSRGLAAIFFGGAENRTILAHALGR